MKDYLLLAVRYLSYYRLRTFLMIGSVALVVFLPTALHWMLGRFEAQMRDRAERTPLVIGERGSRFDLVFHALYFQGEPRLGLKYAEMERVRSEWPGNPVPLFIRHKAKGYPVVGTSLEYFAYRELKIASGDSLTVLGDCVVGAGVARRLNLRPGDRLLSDPASVFDLSGKYPLNMKVAGILEPAWSPDDRAVFVDLKTAWVLDGIGHGHQDLEAGGDASLLLNRSETNVVANAALTEYQEITPDNIESFHFHADNDDLPLTALLAFPADHKTKTLILGRYETEERPVEAVEPVQVAEELMDMVFRVKRFFDLNFLLVGIAALLFLALTLMLSLRLREREMETLFHLGCSRWTVFWIVSLEWCLVIGFSALLAVGLASASQAWARDMLLRAVF